MTKSMICCLVLLINVSSRRSSDTEIVTKLVCKGDAVRLFLNIEFNNVSLVSIYKKDEDEAEDEEEANDEEVPELIGRGYSLSTFSFLPNYQKRMHFDAFQTLWMLDIQSSDTLKIYELKIGAGEEATKDKVQIELMVAPTKQCIPKLSNKDSILIASLETKECGHRTASVKWMEYPGIVIMDKSRIKVPSGNESCTYYACAESPALKCVPDLKISDYCSYFVVEANSSPAVSPSNTEPSLERIFIYAIFAIVLAIGVVLLAILLQIKRFKDTSSQAFAELRCSLLAR